ncbi:hypothetical protein F1649_07590 [Arcticibacter tournemirensis]|uniref:DUF927 domain-containing protein n=1 Tax=Arcticibacter tournemirensis TaxID=699437 RepID=A0A5M9H9X6_9SPHI|nr:hypothetical protein [Arcticibacter tournemirensis]KAA8483742.1 hypothetical protein F1649_07590 [Arcticibacter tournemirensis]
MHPIQTYIQQNKQDGILYKSSYLLRRAVTIGNLYSRLAPDFFSRGKDDPIEISQRIETVCGLISLVPGNSFAITKYAGMVGKEFKLKPADLIKRINKIIDEREDAEEGQELDENETALPKWVDAEKLYEQGFDCRVDGPNTGIYFHKGNNYLVKYTNFTMRPLIHVYAQNDLDNRRLTEVDNGFKKVVLQLPTKAFISAEVFETILGNEGNFITIDGFSKSHLNRLKAAFMKEYPTCYELKTLGWQPEGFFAFSNKIVNLKTDDSRGELVDFNEYGYADVNGTNFLSMSASSIQKEVRAEDDIYENDRYLSYYNPSVSFSEWARLMSAVYDKSGWMGVAYALVSLFRDVVFKVDNFCPLLYAYGAVQAGKSKYAESVSNLFFHEMPAFNLNQGTDFAFFSRLERFRNCPVVFNEFDENAIKEEWFRALKAAFDGEGREKGRGQKDKTKTQKINCTVVIVGQYLSSKDDNAVTTRCILEAFRENNNRTESQIANYERLKEFEKQGLGGVLVELLWHRQFIATKYPEVFGETCKEMTKSISDEGVTVKARILRNYCTTLTMVKLLNDKIAFPFSLDDFFGYCKEKIMALSSHISESDSLASFWKMVEFLLDQEVLFEGCEFKIETKSDVSIMVDRKKAEVKKFEEPKRLLFLRLDAVHPLYMEHIRRQGKNGINKETIQTYMKDQPYFIGTNKGSSFRTSKGKTSVTSSYVFDYDMIDVNLVRISADLSEERTIVGVVKYDANIQEVLGVPKVMFEVEQDLSYDTAEGKRVIKVLNIKCFAPDLDLQTSLIKGRPVTVTGNYLERQFGEKTSRSIEVTKVEINSAGPFTTAPQEAAF